MRRWISTLLIPAILCSACGGGGGSGGSTQPTSGTARLAFHATVNGEPMVGATVTLLDPRGVALEGFSAVTNADGGVATTAIDGVPPDGFIARACGPWPGYDSLCLFAESRDLPSVATLVRLDEETTRAYDPDFTPPPIFCLAAGSPQAAGCGTPTRFDYASDPFANRLPASQELDSDWVGGAKKGTPFSLRNAFLSAIVSGIVGMGFNTLLRRISPGAPDYVDQFNEIESMLYSIQNQLTREFDLLTNHLDKAFLDQERGALRDAIKALNQSDNLLASHVRQTDRSGARLSDPELLLHLKGTCAESGRDCSSWLKANTLADYDTVRKARDTIVTLAPTLFDYYVSADPWTKGGKQTGVRSAQYSTNLFKLYLSIMSALAQAQDIDVRLGLFYQTMIDDGGDICECVWADDVEPTELRGQPCIGESRSCLNPADGQPCSSSCARISQTEPTMENVLLRVDDPNQPNPFLPEYAKIFSSIRQDFIAALGSGVPNFLTMQAAPHLVMISPYFGQPRSRAEFQALQQPLDAHQFDQVLWKLDTADTDKDGAIYDANVELMDVYNDWQIARYKDQYVANYFVQIGSIRGVDLFAQNGVRMGPNPISNDTFYWANESEWAYQNVPGIDPVSLMWGSWLVNNDWRSWYPAHLRCARPITVYWATTFSCHTSSEEVVPGWFRGCWESVEGECGPRQRSMYCDGLPKPDDVLTSISKTDYQAAQTLCGRGSGQFGNFDYRVVSLPIYGFPGNHPTTIGRDWKSWPEIQTPEGIVLSDSTIATNVTPLMYCPVTLDGSAFTSVELRRVAALNEQDVAVCRYADGAEAVFDARVNSYTLLGSAKSSPHAIVYPYDTARWSGSTCTATNSDQCRFVFLDPLRVAAGS